MAKKRIPLKYRNMAGDLLSYLNERADLQESYGAQWMRNHIRTFLRKRGIEKPIFRNGVYRMVAITPRVVFKLRLNNCQWDNPEPRMLSEVKYIRKKSRSKRYARHFPAVELVHSQDADAAWTVCQIMERLPIPKYTSSQRMTARQTALHNEVRELAERLGLGDIHTGNYTWVGPRGRKYPVFLDCEMIDGTFGATDGRVTKRSWMVARA